MTARPINGASCTIVRNLQIRKSRNFMPTRSCRKNTGPLDSILIRRATTAKNGDKNTSPSADAQTLNKRLQPTIRMSLTKVSNYNCRPDQKKRIDEGRDCRPRRQEHQPTCQNKHDNDLK